MNWFFCSFSSLLEGLLSKKPGFLDLQQSKLAKDPTFGSWGSGSDTALTVIQVAWIQESESFTYRLYFLWYISFIEALDWFRQLNAIYFMIKESQSFDGHSSNLYEREDRRRCRMEVPCSRAETMRQCTCLSSRKPVRACAMFLLASFRQFQLTFRVSGAKNERWIIRPA